MVRPRSCWVIYYFDTPTLGRRHQSLIWSCHKAIEKSTLEPCEKDDESISEGKEGVC
jgi:hypothetical protein